MDCGSVQTTLPLMSQLLLFLLSGHFWFLPFSLFTLPVLFIPFSFISLYSLIFSCREEDDLFAVGWSVGRGWWFMAWFSGRSEPGSVVSLRGFFASVGCSIRYAFAPFLLQFLGLLGYFSFGSWVRFF